MNLTLAVLLGVVCGATYCRYKNTPAISRVRQTFREAKEAFRELTRACPEDDEDFEDESQQGTAFHDSLLSLAEIFAFLEEKPLDPVFPEFLNGVHVEEDQINRLNSAIHDLNRMLSLFAWLDRGFSLYDFDEPEFGCYDYSELEIGVRECERVYRRIELLVFAFHPVSEDALLSREERNLVQAATVQLNTHLELLHHHYEALKCTLVDSPFEDTKLSEFTNGLLNAADFYGIFSDNKKTAAETWPELKSHHLIKDFDGTISGFRETLLKVRAVLEAPQLSEVVIPDEWHDAVDEIEDREEGLECLASAYLQTAALESTLNYAGAAEHPLQDAALLHAVSSITTAIADCCNELRRIHASARTIIGIDSPMAERELDSLRRATEALQYGI